MIKELLNETLVDDSTDNGGVSYKGETLEDFLYDLGYSHPGDNYGNNKILELTKNQVNELLIENGIQSLK